HLHDDLFDGVHDEPEDGARYGHGVNDLAAHEADGGGHGGQPDLVLLYATGVAAVPYERELLFEGGRVGDGVRRVALQPLREDRVDLLREHVRQEDLAGGGGVHRGALPDPVDGGDRRRADHLVDAD